MVQQYEEVMGMDFTLPAAPPLTLPPLSLLDEARTLINLEGLINRKQQAVEKAASAAEQLEAYDRMAAAGPSLQEQIDSLSVGDQPGEADSIEDARKALEQQQSEWDTAYLEAANASEMADAQVETLDTQLKYQQQFERGFVYLPELSNAESVTLIAEDSLPAAENPGVTAIKAVGPNQNLFGWYDPFVTIGLDSRSLFGWPNADMADRVQRADRALRAHEGWQAEREFWCGAAVPTNPHLTAGPGSAQTSPHRSLRFPFALPLACPGTVLGVAESLSDSLAVLDQAIANGDGGTGMIHATCYVVQKWSQVYPFLRDAQGNIRTVNNNLIVPGYGYPGTGPDQTERSVDDAVLDSTTAITSATADFSIFDVGQPIEGDGIPPGTVIEAVASATDATLSQAATATGTGVTITLPGTGGDLTGAEQQWAYATDMVYHLQGDVMTYPLDLREQSPDLPVANLAEARAERTHALITNNLVRSAVLIDTTTI